MRHHFYTRRFFYGVIIIGLCFLVGFLLLRPDLFYVSSGKKTETPTEVTGNMLPSPTIADEVFSTTATIIPTPLSLMTEIPAATVSVPVVTSTASSKPVTTSTEATKEMLPPAVTPVVSASETVTAVITTPVYIIAGKNETATEVWQFSPENERWLLRYSVASTADKPEEVTIPPEEMARMETYLAGQTPPIPTPDESAFKRYPLYLALSPDIKQLAFVDRYLFSADMTETGQFGVKYTGNFPLATGQPSIFFQVSKRVFVNKWYEITGLDIPFWSPNSQYFSVEYEIRNQYNTPLIFNVNTGTVKQLESAAELHGPIAWSPDSTTVVLYLYRSGFDSPGDVIRLCEVEPVNCRDIELDGVWLLGWHGAVADWTAHRNRIIFTGTDRDINTTLSPTPVGLYLFDPETSNIRKVLKNFSNILDNPHWSPDGRLIAAEYIETEMDKASAIAIVDPDIEQIIGKIPIEGCSSWQWAQNSQSILQLPCFRKETNGLKIFNFDGSSRQVELPAELSMKKRLGFYTLKLP